MNYIVEKITFLYNVQSLKKFVLQLYTIFVVKKIY